MSRGVRTLRSMFQEVLPSRARSCEQMFSTSCLDSQLAVWSLRLPGPVAWPSPFTPPFFLAVSGCVHTSRETLLSPSAAAYVQPWLDKSGLDKYLYPAAAAPFPLLYPGIPAAAAAAAAAAFPCLSSVLSPPPEKAGSAAGAPLLTHEVAPPGPLRPQHAHGRTHLPRVGNPECSQEDASLPAKDAP